MYIRDGSLSLRNAVLEDASILCDWWNDGKVMAHAGFPNGIGTTNQEVSDSIKSNTDQNRLLIIENNGIPIGEMNYRTVNDGVAEIGIKICINQEQGKGNGTRLLRMLINTLFNDLGYNKIILDTNLNNIRAQHVYEKLGFKKVRVNIDAWRDQLGELQSSVDYELLKDDYLKAE